MANYTENFTSVNGNVTNATELETEFDAIATAIATKMDTGTSVLTDTAFHVRRDSAADQSFSASAYTKIQFDSEVIDAGSNFNNTGTGNGKYGYTVPTTGTYLFVLGVGTQAAPDTATDQFACALYWDQGGGEDTPVALKNGGFVTGGTTAGYNINCVALQKLTAGDIIFGYAFWTGTAILGVSGTNARTYFMGGLLG